MINIEEVTKSFAEKKVLKNLNLEVKRKRNIIIAWSKRLWKNNTTKHTFRLNQQNEGNIYINDILVSGKASTKKVHLKPPERKVGYVFQTVSLFPHMRVKDNVSYGLKALHLDKQEVKKRTESLLDFVGLREYERFYPSQLSGDRSNVLLWQDL